MTTKITQQELNRTLWQAADSSRSAVDAAVYKDYVLAMLFFKYISDIAKVNRAQYMKQYKGNHKRVEEKLKLDRFYVPKDATFDAVYKKIESDNIGEEVNKALHLIEDENKEKIEGIFSVDFNRESILGRISQRNKMIRSLIQDFHKIDLSDVGEDVLGESYMYMIERFGAAAGKKAGEFFTVRNVAKLVAKLAQPKPGDRICDFATGSGGLLLFAGKEVEAQGSKDYALYGQESTGSTFQLARMNIFLHGKDSAHLEWGDTLNNPLLVENGDLIKFDVCVANPPFSLKKWGAENAESDPYRRFHRGVPPKDKGDYAFISHMIETLKVKTGHGAIIVPHGVLFRGGAEGTIRKKILEENLIDAIIGLPKGLFSTTDIPVAIVVIDRTREQGGENEHKKDILFIEASKEFKPEKAQNILTEKHIEKIYKTYANRKNVEKFARVVKMGEIIENDYNLNITRYVDTFEEEDPVDIEANLKELAKIEPELKSLEKKMDEYLKVLGIKK